MPPPKENDEQLEVRLKRATTALTGIKFDLLKEAFTCYEENTSILIEQGVPEDIAKKSAAVGAGIEFVIDKIGIGIAGAGIATIKKNPLAGTSLAVTGAAIYAFAPEIGETTSQTMASFLNSASEQPADALWSLGHYYSWQVPKTSVFAEDRSRFYHGIMHDEDIELGNPISFEFAIHQYGPSMEAYTPQQVRVLKAILYADFMDAKELKAMQSSIPDVFVPDASIDDKKAALNIVLEKTMNDNEEVLTRFVKKIEEQPYRDKKDISDLLDHWLGSKFQEVRDILIQSVSSINGAIQAEKSLAPDTLLHMDNTAALLLSTTHAGFQLLNLVSPQHATKLKEFFFRSQQLISAIHGLHISLKPLSKISGQGLQVGILNIGNIALGFSGFIGATSALISLFQNSKENSQSQQLFFMLRDMQFAITQLDERIQNELQDISKRIGAYHYQSLMHFEWIEHRAFEDTQSIHQHIQEIQGVLRRLSVEQHQKIMDEIKWLQHTVTDLDDAKDFAEFQALVQEIERVIHVNTSVAVADAINIKTFQTYLNRLSQISEIYRLRVRYLTELAQVNSDLPLPQTSLSLAISNGAGSLIYQNRVDLHRFRRLMGNAPSILPPALLSPLLRCYQLLIENYRSSPFHLPLRAQHLELVDKYMQEAVEWITKGKQFDEEKIIELLFTEYLNAVQPFAEHIKSIIADSIKENKNERIKRVAHPNSSRNIMRNLFIKQCQKNIEPFIPVNWYKTYATGDMSHPLTDMNDATEKREGLRRIFREQETEINRMLIERHEFIHFMKGEVDGEILILPVPIYISRALPAWLVRLEEEAFGSLTFSYEWLAIKGELRIVLGFEPLDKAIAVESSQLINWIISGLPYFEEVARNHARFLLWSIYLGRRFWGYSNSVLASEVSERKEATYTLGFKGSPNRYTTTHYFNMPDEGSLIEVEPIFISEGRYPCKQDQNPTDLASYEQEYNRQLMRRVIIGQSDRAIDDTLASIHAMAGYFLDAKDTDVLSYILKLNDMLDSQALVKQLIAVNFDLEIWESDIKKAIETAKVLSGQGAFLFSNEQYLNTLRQNLSYLNISLKLENNIFPSSIHENDMPLSCQAVPEIRSKQVLMYLIEQHPEVAAKCLSLPQVLQLSPPADVKHIDTPGTGWARFLKVFRETLNDRIFSANELVALSMLGIKPGEISNMGQLLPGSTSIVPQIELSPASSKSIAISELGNVIDLQLEIISIYAHPLTHAWIYVIGGFYNGAEVVRAAFYGQLGYCTLSGRSNVIDYHDPHQILNWDTKSSLECSSLPPTIWDTIPYDLAEGLIQGGVLGITEKRMPHWQVLTVYYTATLGTHFLRKYYETNIQEPVDISRLLLESVIETGEAISIHVACQLLSNIAKRIETELEKRHQTKPQQALSILGKVSSLGMFGYAALTKPTAAISSFLARGLCRRYL